MRKNEVTANVILALPLILALVVVVLLSWPLNAMVMGGLYLCGLCDLMYAKQPLWRHHIFNSFGPTLIPMRRRAAYFRGYKRIAFGVILNVLIVIQRSMATGVG